ncbi:unnamed protein product [Polarella glacialis]|uniref:Uncharacterized protein n=2 Tax=Polarella glacialis TaxID=89957 RepID=A0A813GGQ7_POLGL|nr:unnamed protein product [Polarella glacialis]
MENWNGEALQRHAVTSLRRNRSPCEGNVKHFFDKTGNACWGEPVTPAATTNYCGVQRTSQGQPETFAARSVAAKQNDYCMFLPLTMFVADGNTSYTSSSPPPNEFTQQPMCLIRIDDMCPATRLSKPSKTDAGSLISELKAAAKLRCSKEM